MQPDVVLACVVETQIPQTCHGLQNVGYLGKMLDSAAAFKDRAASIGVTAAELARLEVPGHLWEAGIWMQLCARTGGRPAASDA